jgi:hypothetical protein
MTATAAECATQSRGAPALLGQRVSFTGRLATMSRPQAEALVTAAAGQVSSSVTPRTTMLVVGMRGWPLMNSGHVSRKLAAAERSASTEKPVRVVTELQFRELVGLGEPPESANRPLSAQQVCAALGIDSRTLQRWEHCGLVRSFDGKFDFPDLVSLRTVTDLVARGVSPVIIRSSLDAMRRFLPGVDRPLSQLNILVGDKGSLVAELEDALLTTSGQLELRFNQAAQATVDSPRPLSMVRADARDSAGWIEAGLEHEENGDMEKAEHAYRRAAALAPNDAAPQFNLGNVLFASGRLEAAAERYAQAVAIDPLHAQAWFNLAHVQDELDDPVSALRYLRRAIAADPDFADAHFNLAELAERSGDRATAADSWDSYIRLDPMSEWGREAKRRVGALRSSAWA